MPKLHFLDVGLACWLLGIRRPEHLKAHPLRGALFESWVVSEVRKHRLHRGQPSALHFYRDHGGAEADLLIESPEGMLLAEIKAGQTVSSDSLKALKNVAAGLPNPQSTNLVLVYGGEEQQARTDTLVLPWRALHDIDWCME